MGQQVGHQVEGHDGPVAQHDIERLQQWLAGDLLAEEGVRGDLERCRDPSRVTRVHQEDEAQPGIPLLQRRDGPGEVGLSRGVHDDDDLRLAGTRRIDGLEGGGSGHDGEVVGFEDLLKTFPVQSRGTDEDHRHGFPGSLSSR